MKKVKNHGRIQLQDFQEDLNMLRTIKMPKCQSTHISKPALSDLNLTGWTKLINVDQTNVPKKLCLKGQQPKRLTYRQTIRRKDNSSKNKLKLRLEYYNRQRESNSPKNRSQHKAVFLHKEKTLENTINLFYNTKGFMKGKCIQLQSKALQGFMIRKASQSSEIRNLCLSGNSFYKKYQRRNQSCNYKDQWFFQQIQQQRMLRAIQDYKRQLIIE